MRILEKISAVAFLVFYSLPAFVLAAATPPPNGGTTPNPNGGTTDGASFLTNPISSTSVSGLLTKLLDLVVQIGVVVVTLGIIYAGFLYVTARGNTSKVSKAHETFYLTIIGAAIVLGAFAITQVVGETAKQLLGS